MSLSLGQGRPAIGGGSILRRVAGRRTATQRNLGVLVLISFAVGGCEDSPADGPTSIENEGPLRSREPSPPKAYVHPDPPATPANQPGDPARRDKKVATAREQIAAGQWKKSIGTLESALAVGPESVDLRILLGIARSNHAQDLAGARREFLRALALDPTCADALVYLAEVESAGANHDLARSYVEAAILADKDHRAALVMAVEMRRRSAEYKAAGELVEHLLRVHPDSARGYAERAVLRQKRGDPDAAIEDLRQAVSLDPVDTAARWALATALRRAGRTEEAEVARVDFELLKSIFSKSMHDLEPDPIARAAILARINDRFPELWQGRIEAAKLIASTRGSAAVIDFLTPTVATFPDVAAIRAHLAAHMEAVGDKAGASKHRAELARIEALKAEGGS